MIPFIEEPIYYPDGRINEFGEYPICNFELERIADRFFEERGLRDLIFCDYFDNLVELNFRKCLLEIGKEVIRSMKFQKILQGLDMEFFLAGYIEQMYRFRG